MRKERKKETRKERRGKIMEGRKKKIILMNKLKDLRK